MKSDAANATADVQAAVTNPRREYTVKNTINQGGVEKVAGEKVNLTDSQAEKLRASGHI